MITCVTRNYMNKKFEVKFLVRLALITICFFMMSFKIWADTPINILVDEWPPYHYLNDNNQVKGFASEVFSAVMQEMRLSYHLTLEPFDEVLIRVKEGEVDGSFLAAKDHQRSTFAYFSNEPVYESEWALLTNTKKMGLINKYSDLESLTIGVVKNYVYSPEFIKAKTDHNISLKQYENDSLNYQMLLVGKVDYVVGEKNNSLWFLRHNNLQNKIQVVPSLVIARNPLYFIWSKKRSTQAFADRFSIHLKEYKKTKRYKTLIRQYIHD